MFPTSQFIGNDPHSGPMTDMFFMVLNGQRVLFTASSDGKIRAFILKEDNTLQKQIEHPVNGGYVTRFIKGNDSFLICALSNGKFLGWMLDTNSFQEQEGHLNSPITAILRHQSFVLSADGSGKVQVRDLNQQFNQIAPETNISSNHV